MEDFSLKTLVQLSGKTYREIAELLHLSIATISRIINADRLQDKEPLILEGERATLVFRRLEKGETLANILIALKYQPKTMEHLYDE